MLGSLTVLTLAVAVWRPYVYHPPPPQPSGLSSWRKKRSTRYYPRPVSQSISLLRKTKRFLRMNWTTKPTTKRACMNMWYPRAIPLAAS
ncbi:hypothetical protein ACLK2H_10715 [Escherichia coli]